MAVLDGTIANTALPTIARDLGASPTASIWVVNAFQLAVTATLFTFASLGQLRGAAHIYRIGVVLFTAGSLACAVSRTIETLIAARAFQGLGAAAIMAITPAILRDIFPRAQLGRALGYNALVVATSSAAGPTVGGLLLAIAPWPWLFAVNVPLGIANVLLNRALPDDEHEGGLPDPLSAVSSALGFSGIIWGLDGFARHDAAWTIAARLCAGAFAGAFFVRRQFALPQPMIALDLFKIPPFTMAALTSFGSFTAQGLAYVGLPFYFQVALGRTPLESGLLLSAWPISVAIVAPFAGRLSDRVHVGVLATAGLAVFTIGLALYALLGPHPTTLEIVLHGIVCGLGFGFFQSPNNRELIGSAPRAKTPSASGILAAVRVSAQTVGAALVAIVFGVFGAQAAAGHPESIDAVTRAAPLTLWVACACAGLGTIASGIRLVRR